MTLRFSRYAPHPRIIIVSAYLDLAENRAKHGIVEKLKKI
tara:strand:- start:10551 stop:10670 length:120 start_codon:yes stop_codon:yes gene_type:complete